jgi:hypothetical protein
MDNIYGKKFLNISRILLSVDTIRRYNELGNEGDILINEVSVQNTELYTYYETLGWNQGGVAGGYTGRRLNVRVF